jgi:hypothetical protein
MKLLTALALGWFVVTYSDQKVAGPFLITEDCQDVAKIMSQKYWNVSPECRFYFE